MAGDDLLPLQADAGGTCDWGHCDDEAIAERRAPGHERGWLPVCDDHIDLGDDWLPDDEDDRSYLVEEYEVWDLVGTSAW